MRAGERAAVAAEQAFGERRVRVVGSGRHAAGNDGSRTFGGPRRSRRARTNYHGAHGQSGHEHPRAPEFRIGPVPADAAEPASAAPPGPAHAPADGVPRSCAAPRRRCTVARS